MTTTTKLVEFSFLSPVCLLGPQWNAEVFVVVVVLGLCAEARSVAPRKARFLAFLRSETNRC